MTLIVQKYGGTSLGSPERIRAVSKRIAQAREQGHLIAVVVSAMGHTTDELISLAHQVSNDPPHREMDMLLTAGERVSMALLSMALADQGVSAMSFTGSQSGIITTQNHRRARICRILGDRVRGTIAKGQVAIVAGFQGVSDAKEITTLGRGGSDTTAVALAAALDAEVCEIYTDVDGVYSADPATVPEAKLWPRIPLDLMTVMAWSGAGVLHARSVEMARQFGVAVRVRNSLNKNEGTKLVQDCEKGMEEFGVTGVSADSTQMLMTVRLARPTALGALWDCARALDLALFSPVFSGSEVSIYVKRDAEGEWKKLLEKLCSDGFVQEYQLDQTQVPLTVTGYRFSQDGSALQLVIDTLAEAHISVSLGMAAPLSITVAVPAQNVEEGVRAVHGAYFGK